MTYDPSKLSDEQIRRRLTAYTTCPALGTYQQAVVCEAKRRGILPTSR